MVRKGNIKKLLSLLLAAVMCLSLLPVTALAEEAGETVAKWTITTEQTKEGAFASDMTDITADASGTMTYSSNRFGGSGWKKGNAFFFSTPTTGYTNLTVEGKVRASKTGPASVQLEGKISDSWVPLGESISIGNASTTTTKEFSVSISETAMENQPMAEFRLVVDTDLAGNGATIGSGGTLYIESYIVVTGTSSSGGGTDPVDPSTPPAEDPDVVPIKTALEASSGEFTVKGVVTLIDGSNVYIQDETGGICVRVSKTPDVKLGDTVIGKGTRGEYYGLPQLNSGTCTKQDSGLPPLTAKKYSVFSDLQKEDICTYVSFEGLEVTIVDDNNGSFSNPNITVKDSSGATLQIYKAVIDKVDGKWSVAVGDKLNLSAAVGCYKETFQLRNTLSTEIQVVSKEQEPDPEPPTTGTTWTKVNLEDIKPEDQIAITMTTSDGATYLLPTVGNGKKGQPLVVKGEVSGTTLTTADSADLTWNITTAEGGYYISSGGSYLSLTNDNNGVRIKDIQTVWTVDGAYLTAKDSAGNTRYLGVYSSSAPTDWRAYKDKSGSGNIEGQTVGFWKLTAGGGEPTPSEGLADGEYIIWNPEYNKALSSTKGGYSNFYNVGVDVTVSGTMLYGAGQAEIWTVKTDASGDVTISFGGKNLGLGASYTSMDLGAVYDKWRLEDAGNGLYFVRNVGRDDGDYYMTWSSFETYQADNKKSANGDERYALKFTPASDVAEDTTNYYLPVEGDQIVIYSPAGGVVMNSTMGGTNAVLVGDTVLTDGSELVFTVHVNAADGTYQFETDDGRLLDLPSGSALFPSAASTAQYPNWKLSKISGGWKMRNADGSLEKSTVEYYGGKFTNYYDGTDSIYAVQFLKADSCRVRYPVDDSWEDVEAIASWGGGADYDDYADKEWKIPGDLFVTNDLKDSGAYFQAVVSGQPIRPVPDGTSPYFGGKGLGSGTDDYMQFVFSTLGWGQMTLSFRMRLTGSSPNGFQLQYSVDGGKTFENFTTGTYICNYTDYSGGSNNPVATTKSGAITDGKILGDMSYIKGDAHYTDFTFDVPAGAENVKDLIVRMVPDTTKTANGNEGKPGSSNNVRIDSVVFAGYPIVDEGIVSYVDVEPNGEEDQAPGTALTMTCATPGAEIFYRFNGTGEYLRYDPENKPVLPEPLPAYLEVYATASALQRSVTRIFAYASGHVPAVKMNPNGGGVYFAGTDPIEVTLTCEMKDATIYYITYSAARPDEPVWKQYEGPISSLKKGFGSLTIEAYAVKDGYADSPVTTRTFTERSSEKYNIYFGQMHSHTTYSDGAGTAKEAYDHVKSLDPDLYNMDFLFVTDHSNSFDDAGGSKTINDVREGTEWNEGKALAADATTDQFVGAFGYEMTWSNGLGHINTFNSIGFQDRTQSAYTTYSTALQNYYSMLKTTNGTISQFNHPGTTFGDFSDFAYYDEEIDQYITLIEVGNGEGAVGSSGYFPSYEYYTRALDKGWHVAPTNNQDNHKGRWGDANTARSVVLADELTEEAIYDAMRNYRVYASEDVNLEIYYTLDGNIMGTILDGVDAETVHIAVDIRDAENEGGKVEVIVNGGLSAASKDFEGNGLVELDVSSQYNYYYIKITQKDGNIAVTAPVWIGDVEAIGVSKFEAEGAMTVAGQEQTFDLEIYNNESKKFDVSSITVTDQNGKEIWTSTDAITTVRKLNTADCTFRYTFPENGIYTLTVTVKGLYDGQPKEYTKTLEVQVVPNQLVTKIVVDGTHYNDYVSGYYGGNMNNATTIAANNAVQLEVVTDKITAETLKDCSLLVISAPGKSYGVANAGPYEPTTYEPEFLELVKEYVEKGGTVIICGLADYQDKIIHGSVEQNKLLEAIGSTMRINDDEVCDDVNNGGQNYRLYPENFNMDSPWTKGIITKDQVAEGESYQKYSQYSGCSVDIGTKGTWLVQGFETTYSIDSDKDNRGGIDKDSNDPVYFLAVEDTEYGGHIFAAGGVFLSDFEVAAEMDNQFSLPYANRTIFENIMHAMCAPEAEAMLTIAEAREQPKGSVFMVEGYVTSGTTLPATTFFDAIYVQDDTGGITCFPYATTGLAIGTKVRILGYADAYQGDREIQIISLTVLDAEPNVYPPKALTTKQATDYAAYGGLLVKTTGTVSQIVKSGDKISQFKLTDGTGVAATIFVDGYIWGADETDPISADLQEGQTVEAWGLLYLHPEGEVEVNVPVLRVRNMDEIFLIKNAEEDAGSDVTMSGGSYDATKDADASVSVENVTVGEVTGVFVDGVLVDPAYYAIKDENGKTVITFTGEFLATLSGGNHTVTVAYGKEDGHFQVSATLTVAGASRPIPELPTPGTASPSTPTTSTMPATPGATGDGPAKTGDAFSLGLVLGLLLLAGTGMTVTAVSLRRKKK